MKKVLLSLVTSFLVLSACSLHSKSEQGSSTNNSQTPTSRDTNNDLYPDYNFTKRSLPAGFTYLNNHDSLNDQKFVSSPNQFYYGKMPSSGNVRVPVFLIDFDSKPSSSASSTQEEIALAFNGADDDTGWESLRSYYLKSSGGLLSITADIFPWYRSTKDVSYYRNEDNNIDQKMASLFDEIFAHYTDIDFSVYDSDGDGCIDACYYIYSVDPNADTNYWAYQYFYMGNATPSGVNPLYYIWMSAGFFNPNRSGSKMDGIDAETLIHETGHLLGLPDYYDYDPSQGPGGGLGGADMMDYNVGDHGPFNKLVLDWIDPIILDGSKSKLTIDLLPAVSTGQVIMISLNPTSVFSEYLLIDYFTPELLQARQAEYFNVPGIRVYHVDATVELKGKGASSYYDFQYDNSYTTKKLIRYMEQGGVNRLETIRFQADNGMLYREGQSFGIGQWEVIPWNRSENKSFAFSFTVDALTAEAATLSFTL